MLLKTLVKQEEGQEGIWNVPMAGGACLGLVAQTVGDDVLSLVVPFISRNMRKSSWRKVNASILALGSILEGPSRCELEYFGNFTSQIMIYYFTTHPSSQVRYTNEWALDRMFELHLITRGCAVDRWTLFFEHLFRQGMYEVADEEILDEEAAQIGLPRINCVIL